MPEINYPNAAPTGHAGIIQKQQSIDQISHMLLGQSENLVNRLAALLARFDAQVAKQNDGARPEMPLAVRLTCSHDNLIKVEQLISQIELKVFG